MILSNMPASFTSFAPTLPALPSYPSSTSSTRSAKRRANQYDLHQHQRSQYDFHYSLYPPTPIGSDDDPYENDAMVDSVYSDSGYRSSLMAPAPGTSTTSSASRKRCYGDTGLEREVEADGSVATPGGKRRILDLVGGAVRGVWSIITKPLPSFISGAPASQPTTPAGPIEDVDWIACDTPAASMYNPRNFIVPPPSPPSTPRSQRHCPAPPVSVEMTVRSGYDLTMEQRELDAGLRQMEERKRQIAAEIAEIDTTMSQRWVMVPPPPRVLPHKRSHTWSSGATSSGALHNGGTPRRPRPVSNCGRRRVFRSPRCSSLSSPASAYGSKRTSGGFGGSYGFPSSSGRDDDLEMDEDMRRINDNLKKLIREGKEALGAKIEVVYDDDDELYFNYQF